MLNVLRRLIGLPLPQQVREEEDLRVDWARQGHENKAFWARASMCLGSSYNEALFNMPPNYRISHDQNGIHVIGPTVK